jgi:hypothetical protein
MGEEIISAREALQRKAQTTSSQCPKHIWKRTIRLGLCEGQYQVAETIRSEFRVNKRYTIQGSQEEVNGDWGIMQALISCLESQADLLAGGRWMRRSTGLQRLHS